MALLYPHRGSFEDARKLARVALAEQDAEGKQDARPRLATEGRRSSDHT